VSYKTRQHALSFGAITLQVRALLDLQQVDSQLSEDAPVSSAQWALFGHLWPAGLALARHVAGIDIAGLRLLEFGCGLGVPSLLLRARGADIHASDIHPRAQEFLDFNCALNDLPRIPFSTAEFKQLPSALGRYDVLLGADVLYERGAAETVAELVNAHAKPCARVLISDPGREQTARLSKLLVLQGFALCEQRVAYPETPMNTRGRLLEFSRDAPPIAHRPAL